MTTYRAPPGALLAKIDTILADDAAKGAPRAIIDIHLVLALLRFAMAHDAETVSDLEPVIADDNNSS